MNIKWSLIWVLIHSVSLYIVISLLKTLEMQEGFLYLLLAGLGITIIANIVRIYTRKKRFVVSRWFIYWVAVNTFGIWLSWIILNQFAVESTIYYLLLMGLGLVIVGKIFQKLKIARNNCVIVAIILFGVIFLVNNPSLFEGKVDEVKSTVEEKVEEVLEEPEPRDVGAIESKILELVNQERSRNNAGSLSMNDGLNNFARSWSNKMISEEIFVHSDLGFSFNSYAAENIGETPIHYSVVGCGQTYTNEAIAECFVSGWISSPGHHENMINPAFSTTGIGVACDYSKCRATQVFQG